MGIIEDLRFEKKEGKMTKGNAYQLAREVDDFIERQMKKTPITVDSALDFSPNCQNYY